MIRAWSRVAAVLVCFGLLVGPLCAADSSAPINISKYKKAIKVAFVGDSITAGSLTKESYPSQLGRMLGDKWVVGNFAVSGRTLLNKGDNPYQKEKLFKDAKEFKPDVVVIMLGTNDTKPQNWKFKNEFVADYKDLIKQFTILPSKPRIFVCHPCPVFKNGNYHITADGITEEMPMIDKIAKETGAGIIDIFSCLKDKPELVPDNVHPNTEGATVMAKTVFKTLTGNEFVGEFKAPAPAGRK